MLMGTMLYELSIETTTILLFLPVLNTIFVFVVGACVIGSYIYNRGTRESRNRYKEIIDIDAALKSIKEEEEKNNIKDE